MYWWHIDQLVMYRWADNVCFCQEDCMIRYKMLAELVQRRKQAKSWWTLTSLSPAVTSDLLTQDPSDRWPQSGVLCVQVSHLLIGLNYSFSFLCDAVAHLLRCVFISDVWQESGNSHLTSDLTASCALVQPAVNQSTNHLFSWSIKVFIVPICFSLFQMQ